MTVRCCDLEAIFSLAVDKYVCWGHQGHKQVLTPGEGRRPNHPSFSCWKQGHIPPLSLQNIWFLSCILLRIENWELLRSYAFCLLHYVSPLNFTFALEIFFFLVAKMQVTESKYQLHYLCLLCITWWPGLLVNPHSWGPLGDLHCAKGGQPLSVHAYCLEDAQHMPLMRCCYDGSLL